MSEIAELSISMEVNSEIVAAYAMPGRARLDVNVKGVLRRRALDMPYIPATGSGTSPSWVADVSDVTGDPVLVIADRFTALSRRAGYITPQGTEMNGTKNLLKGGEMADLATSGPVILGPELEWEDGGPWALYGMYISTSPWRATNASIFLAGGPWSILLLEFETGTVEVTIERS